MFLKRDNPHTLVVSMTGVKLGDRLMLVGCAHAGRLGAVAAKVGLSGRAVAVAPDEPSAARARKGAADAGVFVEVEVAPPTRLPVENDAFDLAVVDDTGGLFGAMRAADRAAGRARFPENRPASAVTQCLFRSPPFVVDDKGYTSPSVCDNADRWRALADQRTTQ